MWIDQVKLLPTDCLNQLRLKKLFALAYNFGLNSSNFNMKVLACPYGSLAK